MMSIPRDLKVDDPRSRRRTRSTPPTSRRRAARGSTRQDGQEAVRGRDRRGVPDQQRDDRRLRRLPAGGRLHRRRLRRHRPALLQRQLGGRDYATIDIQPGYQKLCGQDALDYVRYRHTDNDLVRAARQQDFLRQAKNAAGVAKLLAVERERHADPRVRRYFRLDKSLRSNKQIFSLLQARRCSCARSNPRSTRSASRPTTRRTRQLDSNLYSQSATCAERLPASSCRRESSADAARAARRADGQTAVARERRSASGAPASRSRASRTPRTRGRGPGGARRSQARLPVLLPDACALRGSTYAGTAPRIYTIRDETGKKHRRLPARARAPGSRRVLRRPGHELEGPADPRRPGRDTVTRRRPQARLYYDGRRVRLVAWQTKRGVYWVSNTLTRSLEQPPRCSRCACALSLRRLEAVGWSAAP